MKTLGAKNIYKENAEHLRGHHTLFKKLDNVLPLNYRCSSVLSIFHPFSVVMFIECLSVITWIILELLNEIYLLVVEVG